MISHSRVAGKGHVVWIDRSNTAPGVSMQFDVYRRRNGLLPTMLHAENQSVSGMSFALNGPFFHPTSHNVYGDTLALDQTFVQSQGALTKVKKRFGFAITVSGKPIIYPRDPLPAGGTSLKNAYLNNYVMAVGGLGLLLQGGVNKATRAILKDPNKQHFQDDAIRSTRRPAIGVDSGGKVMIFVATAPMTPRQMADYMQGEGITDAVFLDGGNSTCMAVNGTMMHRGLSDHSIPCWLIGYE